MTFNLATFRQRVHSIARNQYFVVRIPQVGEHEVITALARSTSIPAVTHGTLPITYKGMEMKISDRPTFDDWTVSFLCDEAHGLRNTFIKWMSLAYNTQNLRSLPHNEYKQDGLSVSQLAADGAITTTVVFVGAFPSSVGEIAVSQDGGELSTFDVTFTYDQFFMNSLDGDMIFSDVDIDAGNDGRMAGVSVRGIAGVNFNPSSPA
jgi:hypothetical protein